MSAAPLTSGMASKARIRLFSSGSLLTVLQERHQAAVRDYVDGCGECDAELLIKAVIDRARLVALELEPVAAEPRHAAGSSASDCSDFAVPYRGNPFLWFLSPMPSEVSRPIESPKGVLLLSVGMNGDNPLAEISRSELILRSTRAALECQIRFIRHIIAYQREALQVFEEALESHLRSLWRPPEFE